MRNLINRQNQEDRLKPALGHTVPTGQKPQGLSQLKLAREIAEGP
jgi:hypothetical protein